MLLQNIGRCNWLTEIIVCDELVEVLIAFRLFSSVEVLDGPHLLFKIKVEIIELIELFGLNSQRKVRAIGRESVR